MSLCFFTADGSTLVPTDVARSLWSENQMHGVAVAGALARGLERDLIRGDLQPARFTLDLFRPPTMDVVTVKTRSVREGKRIALLEAEFIQADIVRARASAIFLAPTETPPGEVWVPTDVPTAPPLDEVPELTGPNVPWFRSSVGWSQDFKAHQNSGRKIAWQYGVPVVMDEPATPFQAVASIADSTSMVTNWGSEGVQFINTDITLSISRLPHTAEVGLRAEMRSCTNGIAVGVASVFDREGVIGSSMVTSLANSQRTVDFNEHDFDDEGNRTSRV